MSDEKSCFVICPIGSKESETREQTEKLLKHIISQPTEEFGYNLIRADKMTDPGSITSQIIHNIVESDLVIADLTGHNPNVFYELAVRHATGKPFIQLIESSNTIPFDIQDLRTIQYGFDVEEATDASNELREHLKAIEESDQKFDNPISQSAELNSLRKSDDPVQQNLAEIVERLNNLNKKFDEFKRENEIYHQSKSGHYNESKEWNLTAFSDRDRARQEKIMEVIDRISDIREEDQEDLLPKLDEDAINRFTNELEEMDESPLGVQSSTNTDQNDG